ncbi:hypothetical protein BMF35_a0057 [Aurantiacibacter gangjinensis]|nr:hypothetical protein BMF35_a0057 [Aurantiacibacter gangjinensis]
MRSAVIHDALVLLVSDEDMDGEWQDAFIPLPLEKSWEFSYAYGSSALAERRDLVFSVIARTAEQWEGREEAYGDLQRYRGGMVERELVAGAGLAAALASEQQLTVFPQFADPMDLDAHYLSGMLGPELPGEEMMARLIRLQFERAMIMMHTVEPDLDGTGSDDAMAMHAVDNIDVGDVNRYLDRYVEWVLGADDFFRYSRKAHDCGSRQPGRCRGALR